MAKGIEFDNRATLVDSGAISSWITRYEPKDPTIGPAVADFCRELNERKSPRMVMVGYDPKADTSVRFHLILIDPKYFDSKYDGPDPEMRTLLNRTSQLYEDTQGSVFTWFSSLERTSRKALGDVFKLMTPEGSAPVGLAIR